METTPPARAPAAAAAAKAAWPGYLGALGLCGAAAVLAWPLAAWLDSASLVLLFLLAVVLSAAAFGRGPALLAAGASVLMFNLAFVPPRLSLSVADQRFLFTFAVMLLVGLVVGQLTAGLKAQAEAARRREQQVQSLYAISRELGQALTAAQVAEVAEHFTRRHFGAAPALWAQDGAGHLQQLCGTADAALQRAAQEAVQETAQEAARQARAPAQEPAAGRPTPQATDACRAGGPGGPGPLLLPLWGTQSVRGVMALPAGPLCNGSGPDRHLLDTCAALLGSALERIHYTEVARDHALEIEGERLRNSLLSAVSHDLRTPLASLVGLSETLQLTRPPPTAEQAEIATAVAATARRMSAVVHNLLDMARLEAGAVRLDLQWQPVEEVLGAALAAAAPVLAEERVRVSLPDDLPLVQLDAVLMERVLVNLLENAAKYTPPGSQVQIEAAVAGDGLEITVSDNGPGLPAGRHELLLRKFERGTREGTTPGVGLGLALCRAIVQAHGGVFTAGDAAGGGARFTIRLPLGQPPALPGDGLPTPAAPPSSSWAEIA